MAVAPLTEGERLRRLIEAPIVLAPLPEAAPQAPPGAGSEFGRSFQSVLGGTVGGIGQIAADLPGVGPDNVLQRFGQEVQARNVSGIQSLSDIVERPVSALGSATGSAAGSVSAMVGARAIGGGLTRAAAFIPHPVARAVVAGAGQAISRFGPALALFAPSYGGIRQRQIEADPAAEGDTGAKLAGVAGGAAMAAVERLGGGERLASILLREGREGLAKEVGEAGARQVAVTGALRNLVTGPVGRTALRAGLTEAAEEAVQSPIEQLASFQNPLTPESLQETAFQTVMGALGGGGIGTAFGVLTPRGKDTVDPSDVSDKDITNVVDGALAASSLRQQAPTEQPDLFEVVPDEELSPQGDLFEQGPPRVGLIPTRLPAVPEQIQPAQEPPATAADPDRAA